MTRILLIISTICLSVQINAQTIINIDNPETWTYSQLSQYVGQTIQFGTPFYVCNNYKSGTLTIAPRRIYQVTNQALPLSDAYYSTLSLNNYGQVYLNGVNDYHRMGEKVHNLVVKVNSQNSLTLISCDFAGNTRDELQAGYDTQAVHRIGEADIIVCCMNLEYYLVENLGTGYGPDTQSEHQKQRAKVSKALAIINADLYGFVEIEQGQSALAEIAADLTKNTGRQFTYINDGGSTYGSFTKAGFVYCADLLQPYGKLRENNTGVSERKKTQAFTYIATGEKFLFSVNHFKAKSGRGSGDNADKNDGQGTFNGDRKREAQSLLEHYKSDRIYYGENDILIMGDLNAYAMEDPITILREGGMTDLHRTFHADSSYSYNYRGYAGYLDHALCNSTMLPQVTGMVAYHINSDESDNFTYDKSNDNSMFRCSDHDPVIVGIRLDSTATQLPDILLTDVRLEVVEGVPHIQNAEGGAYMLYLPSGYLVTPEPVSIQSNKEPITGLQKGLYIINVYGKGTCLQTKIMVK